MQMAIKMFATCTIHHGSWREKYCDLFARVCVVPGAD